MILCSPRLYAKKLRLYKYNEDLQNGENMGEEVGLNVIHVANGIWLDT